MGGVVSKFPGPAPSTVTGRLFPQDGHYVYELGENLTSRCKWLSVCACSFDPWVLTLTPRCPPFSSRSDKILSKMGEGKLLGALRSFVMGGACMEPRGWQRHGTESGGGGCLHNQRQQQQHGPPLFAGTFGRVLECWDRMANDYCAIKIVRNIDKYRHAAMIEVCACVCVCHTACQHAHTCVCGCVWGGLQLPLTTALHTDRGSTLCVLRSTATVAETRHAPISAQQRNVLKHTHVNSFISAA